MEKSNFHRCKKACLLKWTGFFMLSGLLLTMFSCSNPGKQDGATGGIMPNITGGAGEVLVVMDNFNWDNSAGALLQDILKEEISGLPQSEPLFDVIQITAASFDNFYRYHRSVVLTNIDSELEPQIRFRENVWAKPQIVVQMEAPNSRELHDLIEINEERIRNFLVQYDRNRLMATYRDTKDPAIQQEIASHHQIRLDIPRGYNMDFSKDEYTSVSIEAPDLSQVIQVFDYPANGPEDLNTDALIARRNLITKEFVHGPREDSYMTLSPMYPPIAFDLKKGGMDVVELRGLWELENGFMGGPFISHSVYDASRNRIVTVDGYIYYPNQKKRVKLKQLEAIIYSLEII
ncbi:MAG: DUF4837 family protein [Bacteroidales bacterium]